VLAFLTKPEGLETEELIDYYEDHHVRAWVRAQFEKRLLAVRATPADAKWRSSRAGCQALKRGRAGTGARIALKAKSMTAVSAIAHKSVASLAPTELAASPTAIAGRAMPE